MLAKLLAPSMLIVAFATTLPFVCSTASGRSAAAIAAPVFSMPAPHVCVVQLHSASCGALSPVGTVHVGAAGFTYTVDDGHGGTSTANVNVTVNPVNDAPVFSVSLPTQNVQYSDAVVPEMRQSPVRGLSWKGTPRAKLPGNRLT